MSNQNVYAPDLHATSREKLFYTLVMFPYPSGYGLHVGHASNFVINDVLARYKRLRGYTVFNPFGFDSFGLPTENYAMQLGKPAYEVTAENIVYFKNQVAALHLSFDTEREVVTSSPEYYKRTQWLFQQLYKAGLVYRDTLWVNRCPTCQTVLANDQVIDGACERCKSEIIQKKHPQRFIKITAYAEQLLKDLDLVDWPEETKIGQRNWIGKSEGAEIDFVIGTTTVTVFTTRPDTIYGVTALVLAPEQTILDEQLSATHAGTVEAYRQTTLAKTAVQRQKDLKEKTGVFSGLYAIHPLTGEEVPVWYADYVLPDYGTGAVMMVPAHDERDWEFAKKFGIAIKKVIARETGLKRDNEEFKDGGAAVIFDPKTQLYAVSELENGLPLLFAGGAVSGESIQETVQREVIEESGLHNFACVEWIETSYAHYHNILKKVNRSARAECYLFIVENAETVPTALEEHEQFTLGWRTAAAIKQLWIDYSDAHGNGLDHYLRFLQEAVARAIALGYDTTSDSQEFVSTAMTEYGILEQSDQFTGLTSHEAKKKIAAYLESIGKGRVKVSYKLRDRSVSRQRYRGSPIPVYYDEQNQPHLIPEEELPVILPLDLENYKPTGKSPLEDHPTFPVYEKDNKQYRRECDTLDTFMCSSFYFLRYPDANNNEALCDAQLLNKCFPIDFYIGGKEHTVGHLLYARFIHKFLYDQGFVSSPEPFQRLVHQGMVLGADGRKMSKRRGNIIDPMEVIDTYGADAVRTYLMFMGPVEQEKVRNDGALAGIARFLGRIKKVADGEMNDETHNLVQRALHKAIKGVTDDMEALKYNTAVSKLMILLNTIEEYKQVTKEQLASFMVLLFPFAPVTAREVWKAIGKREDIEYTIWPSYDPALLIDETISLPVQINGKVRATIMVAPDADESTVLDVAQQDIQVKKYLDGQVIRKVIYVAGRILNIVV